MADKNPRGNYGLDAPTVIRNLALAGGGSAALGLILNLLLRPIRAVLARVLLIWGLSSGAAMLVTAGMMVWSSKAGKLRVRNRLIESLALRDEMRVLDAGCGRGLLLNAAARRLANGKAIGIDLWQRVDQSGNDPLVTLANAVREGVRERVALFTGDMRQIAMPDACVDVVISSLAIHNIPNRAGRSSAVREIARVLKPGGQAALLDFQCTSEYEETLRELGWVDVRRSGLSFGMFPPVRIVRSHKPSV